MEKKVKISTEDIIREVGSICACNSTLVFSQMINRQISLEAPKLDIIPFQKIENYYKEETKIVVGVHCKLLSRVLGQVSLIFKEKSAYEFVSIFSEQGKHTPGFLTQLGVSTIKEIGNVVVSAYTGAMSLLLDDLVIPSIPILSSGPLSEVIKFGISDFDNKAQIYMHTMTFIDGQKKIDGSFYLVLDPGIVSQISKVMRKHLRDVYEIKEKITGAKKK